jgi:8-oxo-dGTP diphosphatase
MTTELWGIFDLQRQAFVSRSMGHSSQYIGVVVHDPSRAVVDGWISNGAFVVGPFESRLLPEDQPQLTAGCICPVHRRKAEPLRMMNKLEGTINEAETPLPVAVGGLMINAKGEILAVSRKTDHEDLGLPGGKVEPGESEMEALSRELREELSIEAKRFHRLLAQVDNGGYWFVTFLVYDWTGTPQDREGAAVRWVSPLRLTEPSCTFRSYNLDLLTFLRILGVSEFGYIYDTGYIPET